MSRMAFAFLPTLHVGRGTTKFGGGGVTDPALPFTPPPRFTGSPSPLAQWGGNPS